MQEFIAFKYDKLVSNYIQNALSKTNLSYQDLVKLSKHKFNQEDFYAMKNGNFVFGLEEFFCLTQLLNLDPNTIFSKIKSNH